MLDREVSLPEVAAAHAYALEIQIRTLRLRRAVLRAATQRGSSPEEMDLMHQLAKLSDDERRRLITDFIGGRFVGLGANADFVDMMRSAMPELPDDPEPEQVDAWVELAELTQIPTSARPCVAWRSTRRPSAPKATAPACATGC